MTDISPRRRFAGRAALVIGALALPVTASITYAETIVQGANSPAPPQAPAAPVAAPAFLTIAAPLAPDAPPAPPAADGEHNHEVHVERIVIGPDGEEISDDSSHRVMVIRNSGEPGASGEGGHSETHQGHREVRVITSGDDVDVDMAELRGEMEALHFRLKRDGDLSEEAVEEIELKIRQSMEGAEGASTRLSIICKSSGDSGSSQAVSANCTSDLVGEANGAALEGLKAARARLETQSHLSDEMRGEVLRSLDREIAKLTAD